MNGETLSTRFAYHYDLTLSLALQGPEFSAEDRRTLENGINSYNERSIYMNNPKHISLLEMGKNHIKIRLSSTQMLTTPGRGLRALTAILVKTPSFEGRVTPGGQLFRVLHAERPDDRGGAPEAAAISDAELVKALVDYLLERKDGSAASRKKKAAVEAMKRLAIDAAMICPPPKQSEQ